MGGNEYRVMNMPRCKIYRNAALTLAAATQTAIVMDTVEYDNDGMANPAGGSKITCKTPGVYFINGSIEVNAALNDNIWLRLVANGGNVLSSVTGEGQGFGFGSHFMPCGIWPAVAGDYLELYAYDNPTAAGIFTGQASCYLLVCMVSTL